MQEGEGSTLAAEAEVAEDEGKVAIPDEGKVTKTEGTVAIPDEGKVTKSEGKVRKSEGSEATPCAKKARLSGLMSVVRGCGRCARCVYRLSGESCTEVAMYEEDHYEALELQWIEAAQTRGVCDICGCCVDESGCVRCQIMWVLDQTHEAVYVADHGGLDWSKTWFRARPCCSEFGPFRRWGALSSPWLGACKLCAPFWPVLSSGRRD